jgi:hypothetical protein
LDFGFSIFDFHPNFLFQRSSTITSPLIQTQRITTLLSWWSVTQKT